MEYRHINIDENKLKEAEAAMKSVAGWARKEIADMNCGRTKADGDVRSADEGRLRILQHVTSLFGTELIAPESASIVWDSFIKGVRLAFGGGKPVTDMIRNTVIACRGDGINVLPVRWEDMFYLETDFRSALAVMRDDGISPLQATCPPNDPVRKYAEAWLSAIDEATEVIERAYSPLGEVIRADVVTFYNSTGWKELFQFGGDELVRRMFPPDAHFAPNTVFWHGLGDVPMAYGDERKRNAENRAPVRVTLDPFAVRREIDAEIARRILHTDWKDDPVEAGAMKFLTGFRTMLSENKCTGEDILKLFYNMYNAGRLFDTLLFPEAEYSQKRYTVFSMLQNMVVHYPHLLEPGTGIMSPNISAFTRLLNTAGCMPEGPHDAVRHARLSGWLRMKTETEALVMKMRNLTPAEKHADIAAMSNPPLMSSLGERWDTLFVKPDRT